MTKQLDSIGWFIANLHQMMGHDKAAMVIGEPPYNKNTCILCLHERGEATKQQVIDAIGVDT
jgi:hypothetical protein